MKNKTSQKFATVFIGALGAIISTMAIFMMVVGSLQEKIKFSGPLEEMIFTAFVGSIGLISLAMAISAAIRKE